MPSRTRSVGSGVRQRGRAATVVWRVLPLAALLLWAASAIAGPGGHKYLSFRGRVADPYGNPIIGVHVHADGTRQAQAVTDNDGRYQMSFDLGTLETLREHPAGIWLHARSEGWRIRVAGGAPSLAIELSV